jgi:hypothetical protein
MAAVDQQLQQLPNSASQDPPMSISLNENESNNTAKNTQSLSNDILNSNNNSDNFYLAINSPHISLNQYSLSNSTSTPTSRLTSATTYTTVISNNPDTISLNSPTINLANTTTNSLTFTTNTSMSTSITTSTTSSGGGSGSSRFLAIRNWLKQTKWRKSKDKSLNSSPSTTTTPTKSSLVMSIASPLLSTSLNPQLEDNDVISKDQQKLTNKPSSTLVQAASKTNHYISPFQIFNSIDSKSISNSNKKSTLNKKAAKKEDKNNKNKLDSNLVSMKSQQNTQNEEEKTDTHAPITFYMANSTIINTLPPLPQSQPSIITDNSTKIYENIADDDNSEADIKVDVTDNANVSLENNLTESSNKINNVQTEPSQKNEASPNSIQKSPKMNRDVENCGSKYLNLFSFFFNFKNVITSINAREKQKIEVLCRIKLLLVNGPVHKFSCIGPKMSELKITEISFNIVLVRLISDIFN